MTATATPLWKPSQQSIQEAAITRFRKQVEQDWRTSLSDSTALYQFSISELEKFWTSVWDFTGIMASERGERVLIDGDKMPGARWFPDARMNYAENLLQRRDSADAIVFQGEDQVHRTLSFGELYDQVSVLAQALRKSGVGVGDRVVGFMPNMPEAVIAMLAAASIGAAWSSCSPDFGTRGVLDRFAQVKPKVLFTADGYHYNGKQHDSLARITEIAAELPELEQIVVVSYLSATPDISNLARSTTYSNYTADFSPDDIPFEQLPFDHPLYIMFSSGTTGAPKCIIHGAGGSLLKHATEQPIHSNIKSGDRVFYFTTCGWMMWNWLVSNLAWGATLLLYDGSPFYPDGNVLFDFADNEKMTYFGTSAKYIDALAKAGVNPHKTHDLSTVQVMGSTGSPLAPDSFDYVYRDVKPDIHLVSLSGGTDIMGCFCAGDPTRPVWRGEIQCRLLGMAVEIYDDDARPVRGDKGELVCIKPFPSMPVGFLNDPDGSRYKETYFEAYPNIWTHGDYVELTEHDGVVMLGRSDATLNPGGVRIGTAEIYRHVENMDEVKEAVVIGQQWDNDVRVVLFVVLMSDAELDEDLINKIKQQVRSTCTPRHVPAKVLQVTDIPRTKSGKITELAVRDVVHGRSIKNREALANPEALEQFMGRGELES